MHRKGDVVIYRPQQAVVSIIDQVNDGLWMIEFTNGEREFATEEELESL